ncbi:2-succinyl-5-enolpyruvyl-6-hydroxy-3-cyclohexene-1-carboxylic-acid synthase [Bacillus cytotoxicus]|uniref:2-succinyl-5-enolpyruvyl-6-hydroxy-3- cyclohexene-1-carboxylic-acid synthase n=1 Tax=Bacillus cytotoxicus TaxID=580165 RepID=UPI000863CD77|nr:2-succinyl-5-enolpyruvyl-6-hydroxy-3-cyclohexene-1-carboxylic-acid synthase [Bacillus cytotoxicus]AWC30286.1 2-succinyl-5-enolpyruvyl-6-hydroxy-3-cyclohexene-1-carboxylic-acid synthase [Bacillus cytotoxicus]AWC42426.1 2-succinyl-5-enolpyruvyl-6-hydroxy-3-cyclohexene-1-carboxylic-acid synthase [Bacillus cytotoxicus]AWC50357.1 2-succinyl-5-enolpyruvyl-6-hydroxy-3-cyclohexene-1-carboxylic-acid synthase [Bacillus cytotoxicus]AWC54412.1 2-succinyl-5-enolpyruvyl-6-hydroxy-3-cyclohexene-1-carboxyli
MNNHIEALSYYLGAFVDELARLNVCDIVISPGSRSTPLALLMEQHEQIKTYLHVDERSAAFFALGMAKAKKQPVAILCTSGTAAANYYPAICEAYHARVPLLVLTADRPHELRDVGAPQAMNQFNLYGSFVKQFMEMALPEAREPMYQYVRMAAGRAVASASFAPMGPVHMNFPLREPLIPDFSLDGLWEQGCGEYTNRVQQGSMTLTSEYIRSLIKRLSRLEKGLIVCGDDSHPELVEVIAEFAEKTGYPVLADPLSNLRTGSHNQTMIIDCYDTFLRNELLKDTWKPDIIIRFGGMPVSKALTQYIKKQESAVHIIVDESGKWRDPALMTTEVVSASDVAFCKAMTEHMQKREQNDWFKKWKHINDKTKETLREVEAYDTAFEGKVITDIVRILPEGATLFVSNSMPIRDADTFLFTNEKKIHVMANRGVNGIDGIISTALGASTVCEPLVLVIGDLSFYHDLNGLLAAKLHDLNITIVVVNNDGGGIFSFLPQYESKEHFESLFGTPLGLDYEHVVKMYGGSFVRVSGWEAFREEVQKGIIERGLHVVEICTNREENVQLHRKLWAKSVIEIKDMLQGDTE